MTQPITTNSVRMVPIDSITYDPRVQRREGVDERRVAEMAEEWNPAAFGIANLSLRPGGTLVVIDAAHRIAAGRIVGVSEVLSIVHEGLSIQQEAALFLLLNKFKAPSAISKFLARVVKGDTDAIDIADLIESHGWRIQQSADPGCITAVDSLQRIYSTGAGVLNPGAHREVLDWVLDVMTAAWEHDASSANNAVLLGLAQLRARFGPAVQGKKLVHELQQTRPAVLIGKAKLLRDSQGGTIPAAMGKVLVGLHNNRLRTNLLPEWVWTR